MHPEYPCAHCIVSSAVASAIEAMLGTADISDGIPDAPIVLNPCDLLDDASVQEASGTPWTGEASEGSGGKRQICAYSDRCVDRRHETGVVRAVRVDVTERQVDAGGFTGTVSTGQTHRITGCRAFGHRAVAA